MTEAKRGRRRASTAVATKVAAEPDKRARGRPASGVAMTSSERAAKRERELREAGGRTLSRVRLGPEASLALSAIAGGYKTEREAIEAALIGFAEMSVARHAK